MKKILVVALCSLTIFASAQVVKISVDNTEPRVGQEVVLTIDATFFDNMVQESMTSVSFSDTKSSFDRKFIPQKEGETLIGPYTFEFNGKSYRTNEIKLNVIEALPDKEGVWIRKLTIDEDQYILIEQIVISKQVKSVDGNNISISWETDTDNLAELDIENVKGLSFFKNRSGHGGAPGNSREYQAGANYCYKFYKIQRDAEFEGGFKLKEKHFKNLPKGTKVPDIVIDK
jgi:hypothetical protein